MARERSHNRDKAFEIYKKQNGKIKVKDLAKVLNETPGKISTWKNRDEWNKKLNINKVGAPKGNINAVGNKGGAPKGNINGFKNGSRIPEERFQSKKFLAKYLPKVTEKIMDDIQNSGFSALDILWANIGIQYTAIIRSQKLMHVKNQNDMTKELIKVSEGEVSSSKEYEIQFAWDKQEKFIKAQSKAMQTLNAMIRNYEELLHKNWELATEEQISRIEVLKSKINSNENNKQGEGIMIVDDIDD